MAFMSLNGIDVSYDKKKQILKGLNLEVEEGELVSLLGPSGCGKSTTLRVVAGFIDPQDGIFTLDGEDMTKVPVHKRQFGLVFQSYALFPHLSVYDNVAFGLRMRKMDKDIIDKKVKESLEVCGLTECAERFPKQSPPGQFPERFPAAGSEPVSSVPRKAPFPMGHNTPFLPKSAAAVPPPGGRHSKIPAEIRQSPRTIPQLPPAT